MASAALVSGCFSDGKNGATGPAGPKGDTGDVGPQGPPGPGTQPIDKVVAESCATCHAGVGSGHQAKYNSTRDASNLGLTITGVTSGPNAGDATKFDGTMTIHVTQNGVDYNAGIESYTTSSGSTAYRIKGLDQQTFYTVQYSSGAADEFVNSKQFSFTATSFKGAGVYEAYATAVAFDPKPVNGEAYGYVAQGPVGYPSGHIQLYDNVTNTGLAFGNLNDATAGYVSAANVVACENCHGKPYGKHGYRQAVVAGLPDFASCKVCHYDNRVGGDPVWQQMVNDPYGWATGVPDDDPKYGDSFAYVAKIMNDVHMSHAMEFPYPQSMASCTTCHANKLGTILTDANFTAATCKSCHPVTTDSVNAAYQPTRSSDGTWGKAPALETLWAEGNVSWHQITDDCSTCHSAAGSYIGASFDTFHTGYNPKIYDASGTKYSSLYQASIDSVTVDGNVMDIVFSTNNASITKPVVMVSFYGWDTKHFIVSNHTSDANGKRMEKTITVPNTLFTEVARSDGKFEVTLDMGAWAPPANTTPSIPDMIASGDIKKAEISVRPVLTIPNPVVTAPAGKTLTAALNAVTMAYDFTAGASVATPFENVVNVQKCNACHDALGTTFHSGDRGGSITTCRMCHVTTSGGSHIEMQSRGIDSYVHAIHEFQTLDRQNVDFTDPVEKARYEEEIEFVFPVFTLDDCEACHYAGTYNVPDQSKSMGGLLSAAKPNSTLPRAIDNVPEYVTGPASRACGGCHRAYMVKEEAAGDLAAFNQHTAMGGYTVAVDSTNDTSLLYQAIFKIMGMFN